jgi:hypothetical protein
LQFCVPITQIGDLVSSHEVAAQAPLDACGVMETMNDSHVKQLLPRCAAGDEVLERFRQLCLDSKVRRALCGLRCFRKAQVLNSDRHASPLVVHHRW